MSNQTDTIQMSSIQDVVAHMQEGDDHFLTRQIKQLLEIREQLEPACLRTHTEDSLNQLIIQLQEIARDIRCMPSKITETLGISKKTLVKHLHNASIELIMALDQLTTRGQTSYFYKHLVTCQEYLDAAAACKMNSPIFLQEDYYAGASKTPPGNLLMHAGKYCEVMVAAQTSMENAHRRLLDNEEVHVDRFDHVITTLNTIRLPVQELRELLNRSIYSLEETSDISYRLCVNLSYLEDQIPRLLTMIKTFRSIYCRSPRQALRTSKEIAYKLKSIAQSSSEVSRALTNLLNQSRHHLKNEHRLRLIYSSEHASMEEEETP
jgi:hypothetical protein